MHWLEVRVTFEHDDPQLASELISNIFYDFGLQGVVIEGPETEPNQGWGEKDLDMPQDRAVIGYLPKNETLAPRCEELETRLARLKTDQGVRSRVLFADVDEQDWAHAWKAHFWPEKITDRIVIKPSWRDYNAGPGDIILEIDPGMAFGTGTHPTTVLCVRFIEKYLKPGQAFLDVGTGSGILMIAAGRLGASVLYGIDNDPVATGVARENLTLNRIDPRKWEVTEGDLVEGLGRRFDLVAANILSDVIIRLLDHIPRVLNPDGKIICSGITEGNLPQVLEKLDALNFRVVETRLLDGWAALAGGMRHPPS